MAGKFIVIEGTDGAGKGTHAKLLAEWLAEEGHAVETFDFPQYGQPSAYFVEQYLNGHYGDLFEIGPEKGSLFYALDRFAASFKIRAALERGVHVLSNRYVASNMGHQGAKIDDAEERAQYFRWNADLEFRILGIPRPDLNVVLHMPSAQAQKFVDQKAARSHLDGKKRDLHEADLSHLQKAERTYLELCQSFPQFFKLVECAAPDGSIETIDEIQGRIRTLVGDTLK
jgi:dTMP kinase